MEGISRACAGEFGSEYGRRVSRVSLLPSLEVNALVVLQTHAEREQGEIFLADNESRHAYVYLT